MIRRVVGEFGPCDLATAGESPVQLLVIVLVQRNFVDQDQRGIPATTFPSKAGIHLPTLLG